MTDDPIVWTGNPLSASGTSCQFGGVTAELVRVDAVGMFGVDRPTRQLRRTWALNIFYGGHMQMFPACLASVVLVNLMPEAAKRDAERLIRWAATDYIGTPEE